MCIHVIRHQLRQIFRDFLRSVSQSFSFDATDAGLAVSSDRSHRKRLSSGLITKINGYVDGEYPASADVHVMLAHVCANGCDSPSRRLRRGYDYGVHRHVCVDVYVVRLDAYVRESDDLEIE